jgi:anti-sigma regulatory factor (Ser/Thr protein kinase)
MPSSMTLRLPCRPESLRELRMELDGLDHVPPALLDDVKIVATELASDAICHSGLGVDDTIEVSVAAQPGGVRIDVFDEGKASRWSDPAGTAEVASAWPLPSA